jgi:hypothetical protein
MRNKGVQPIIGIYAGLDSEFALFLEEELISKFGRKDLKKGPLLNLTDGGEGAANLNQSARDKISKTHTGRRLTDECKRKLSESTKGVPKKKRTVSNKKPNLVECPHCGRIGGSNVMFQHHFDNCKFKVES